MTMNIAPPKACPTSLQIDTLKLLSRLVQIPQVAPWIQNTAAFLIPPQPAHFSFIMPDALLAQPVELLHATLCLGAPLCTLLDMLGSPSPPSLILDSDPSVFPYGYLGMDEREMYLQSFLQRLGLLEGMGRVKFGEVMRSVDLWTGGSVGWARVLRTVQRVLDGLQETFPGLYVLPADADDHRKDLYIEIQETETAHVQSIRQLMSAANSIMQNNDAILLSLVANLERIEQWHAKILSTLETSDVFENVIDWDVLFGSPTNDQSRTLALAGYRSLCAGFLSLVDHLTSPAFPSASKAPDSRDLLRQVSRILSRIPNYAHILSDLTTVTLPPIPTLFDPSESPTPVYSSQISSSPSISMASLSKPSLLSLSSKTSLSTISSKISLMTIKRTDSSSSSNSNSASTITGSSTGTPRTSPHSTLGRSRTTSYTSSSAEEHQLSLKHANEQTQKSWTSLHTHLHLFFALSSQMAEMGAHAKAQWGAGLVSDLFSFDKVTMDRWGALVLDDKILVSLRRIGDDCWEEVAVEAYVLERVVLVCRATSGIRDGGGAGGNGEREGEGDVYPVMPWSPGPALLDLNRDVGRGSLLCAIPLASERGGVSAKFFSDADGERFVIAWPGHALEFVCREGALGQDQWDMWCTVLKSVPEIQVDVQIEPPPPSPLHDSAHELQADDEEDDFERYIDVQFEENASLRSRRSSMLVPPSRASTSAEGNPDEAYDDASLRVPSPSQNLEMMNAGGGGIYTGGLGRAKPWSLMGTKSEASSMMMEYDGDGDDDEDAPGSEKFVVSTEDEGSEVDGDERPGHGHRRGRSRVLNVDAAAAAYVGKEKEKEVEAHDSGIGLALKRWSSDYTTSALETPRPDGTADFGDLRDLTGQIELEGRYPVASGGYGDVWRAVSTSPDPEQESKTVEGKHLAVKVLRARADDPALKARAHRRLNRELAIWRLLSHPHVLPLLGVAHDAFGGYEGYGYAMVCPWMENGSVSKWMERCGDLLGVGERLRLISEVADGLAYLHSRSIIHGDLSGSNILINMSSQAVLCDFGLSTLVASLDLPSDQPNSVMGGGSVRWADATFFRMSASASSTGTDGQTQNSDDGSTPPTITIKSDVYSFGSVMLEILSNRIPYHYIKTEAQVVIELYQGIKPRRPAMNIVDDEQWELIGRCWDDLPERRPDVEEIRERLEELRRGR